MQSRRRVSEILLNHHRIRRNSKLQVLIWDMMVCMLIGQVMLARVSSDILVTARNKELSRRDLIKLPKRKEAEGSDVHSLQQILRNPSTSLHDSKDGIRDHGSMDVTSSIYNDWTTHLHQEQEINFELDSSGSHSGCTEEILSFPPTPSGRFLQPSTISSYDLIRDLDEKSEDHMSDDDEIISFSGEVAAQPSQNDIASSSSILSSVSKAPSPPLVAFRLPGDRSGLGKPLNRWIGDGKEDEAALSNSSEHPDSFSDEDTMHLHDSEDWILQPYEQMLPVGQSATSIATNSEDIGMATRHAGLSLNISSPTITLNEEDSTRLVRPQIGNVQREDLPDDPGSQELSLDDVYNELKNSLKASNQTIEDQPLFFLAPSLF
ncbi:hypothetical protein FRC15_005535 [Serendipita sp. 397]|nr:hypothetical protein FRC15_005535 [Serendipita sp. 397]